MNIFTPFARIRRILWRMELAISTSVDTILRYVNVDSRATRARISNVEQKVDTVLDLLRGKPVVSMSLSVGEPVNLKPPYQKLRVAGFDNFSTPGSVGPYHQPTPHEYRLLVKMAGVSSSRRRLCMAMGVPNAINESECIGHVLRFCHVVHPNDLMVGEALKWLKRLLARTANVRTDE